MKTLPLLPLLLPLLLLAACEKKTDTEKAVDRVENKVKDATDSRPGEKVRDAVEDLNKK